MDFLVRELSKSWQPESLRECVNAGVAEEGDAFVVWGGNCKVVFHRLGAVEVGKVVGFVEVLGHTGAGCEVVVGELNAASRGVVGKLGARVGEEGRLDKKGLVRVENGAGRSGAEDELDYGGAEVAARKACLLVVNARK